MSVRIDNYKIHYTLGSGGFGKVKLASNKKRQKFAIKVFYLTDGPIEKEEKLKSLKVEADAYKKLKHHHLVKMIKYRS